MSAGTAITAPGGGAPEGEVGCRNPARDGVDPRIGDPVVEFGYYLSGEEAAAAYGALRDLVIPSSHVYVPCGMLGEQAPLASYVPVAAAAVILRHLARLRAIVAPHIRDRVHGFEVWTTRVGTKPGNRIYLHRDCDEALRRERGTLRFPMIGSVLYLGPAAGLAGGETAFVVDPRPDRHLAPFAFHDWTELADASGMRRVAPEAGKLALFSGDLLHGQAPVVAHPDGAPRVVLLANLWDARIGDVPDGICRLPPDAFQAKTRA